jgi:hypothetical protein
MTLYKSEIIRRATEYEALDFLRLDWKGLINAVTGEVPRFLAGVEVFLIHCGWKSRCHKETKRAIAMSTTIIVVAILFRRLASMHRDYAGIAA